MLSICCPLRNVLENQTMELRQRLEETAEGHIEELHQTGKELQSQRQQAQEYSEKVLEFLLFIITNCCYVLNR